MFDLAKAVSKSTEKEKEKQKVKKGLTGCSLFYQTAECKSLLEEVFRFEGWPTPTYIPIALSNSPIDGANLKDIIVLELNNSKNVVEDAKIFSSRLPNHKGIVVIGKEDAISTLRALKEMGLYYLFWPITKKDITDFLHHMHSNIERFAGVSNNRKAKSVAVIGSKGGVGTTLISAEIASKLSSDGTDTILVDHQYHGSNLDIILGLKKFEKQNVENLGLQLQDADENSAADYLLPAKKFLRILALQGERAIGDLLDYSHSIIDLLDRQANFIIEDYSASVDFKLDIPLLSKRVDMIVLIVEPSVSSVRNARKIIDSIMMQKEADISSLRVFVIINSHRPDKYFPLTKKEVTAHLGHDVNAEIPYIINANAILLQGKRLHENNAALSKIINDMSLLLQGRESIDNNTKFSLRTLANRIKQ